MQVLHQVPAREARHHDRDLDCPCQPSQTVTKRPGEQPAVTVTHHPIPEEPR